jgi:tetratricopeptide (TPR) repeat protein
MPTSAVFAVCGLAYKHKQDRAIADYTKAIEIDPNDGLDYNNRGDAYKE